MDGKEKGQPNFPKLKSKRKPRKAHFQQLILERAVIKNFAGYFGFIQAVYCGGLRHTGKGG